MMINVDATRRRDPRKKQGGAAFPHTAADGHPDYRPGMTLRQYYAAKALQGMMAHDATGLAAAISAGEGKLAIDNTARLCFALADEMLRQESR